MTGLLTLIGAAVLAQATPSADTLSQQGLSLGEAIKLSTEHSAAVKEAQSAYLAAVARTGQEGARKRPQIDFTGSATRFDNRTTVSFPGAATPFELAPNNQEELTLAIIQDLDVSGVISQSVSQAKLNALAAQYAARAVTDDEALATTTAYYAVLRAEQNVKVATASLEAYQQQQSTTTRLFKGGVGQKIDVYRADSQVADATSERVRRLNELDAARSAFNDRIGHALDEAVALVDPSSDKSLDKTSFGGSRPELIAQALGQRPEALEATLEVKAAQRGINVARRSSEPSVLLSLSGSRYPTTSFALPRQNTAALSLTVGVPISDGGLARERVKEARQGVVAAQAREDRTRRDIALQVQNAALDVETASKRREAASVQLEAAVAARKLAQQRYESQVGLYIEVTDAQSALTAAQAALVQATYDLLTARAQLAHAVHNPITN